MGCVLHLIYTHPGRLVLSVPPELPSVTSGAAVVWQKKKNKTMRTNRIGSPLLEISLRDGLQIFLLRCLQECSPEWWFMFPSCICTTHRWEKPMASSRVKLTVCARGGRGTRWGWSISQWHKGQFAITLFCQLFKAQNITISIHVFSVLLAWNPNTELLLKVFSDMFIAGCSGFCFSQESQL